MVTFTTVMNTASYCTVGRSEKSLPVSLPLCVVSRYALQLLWHGAAKPMGQRLLQSALPLPRCPYQQLAPYTFQDPPLLH